MAAATHHAKKEQVPWRKGAMADERAEAEGLGGGCISETCMHACLAVPNMSTIADTIEINLKKWLVEADESLSSPHKCGSPETHHPCNYPTAETP